jgi:hypothetical protein
MSAGATLSTVLAALEHADAVMPWWSRLWDGPFTWLLLAAIATVSLALVAGIVYMHVSRLSARLGALMAVVGPAFVLYFMSVTPVTTAQTQAALEVIHLDADLYGLPKLLSRPTYWEFSVSYSRLVHVVHGAKRQNESNIGGSRG